MYSNYLAPFFWYVILRAAFSRLRPSKSSTINSTSLALSCLYAIAFREGLQAVLHTTLGQFTALEVTHVKSFFLPSTILFTKKKQDLFHDSQDYVECSEHSTSIEIPIYIFDETLYTWKIVEKAPTFYVRGNTFENDATKVRRCKRPRKCNGPLYYLRHIRSCAVSNQCQCSVSGYMKKSSIRKDLNDAIIILERSYGGGNTNDSIVIMEHSYERGKRIGATFRILFTCIQAFIDKIKFFFEMILFSVSCTSPAGDPIHVNFDVLSLSITQARIRASSQGKFVPRARPRFISGGGDDSNAGNVTGFGDTPQNYNGFDAHFSRCQEVLQIVCEERNGHCGILALQRTKRRYLGSPNHNVVSEGRQELIDAYRKHRAAFLQDHGTWFNVNDEDINRRIRIHLAAKEQRKCSTYAWVNAMDLVIWSMETGQIVYVVRHGEAHVDVFSGISIPCECKVPLTAFTPGPEDIVLYFVDGVHFDTLLYRAEKISTTELTPSHSSKFLQVNVCIQFSHAFFFFTSLCFFFRHCGAW